jgi:hypothetical protein
LEEKAAIIRSIDDGMTHAEVVKRYKMPFPTISGIMRQREKILKAAREAPPGLARVEDSSRRHPLQNEVEKLVLVWFKQMRMRGQNVNMKIINAKALDIFHDLKRERLQAGEEVPAKDFKGKWSTIIQNLCVESSLSDSLSIW